MLKILDQRLQFPDPSRAPRSGPNSGLVAVGGDLSVERLLLAYRSGIFPWSENPITWWSPDPRGIMPLSGVHVSRSLARFLRRCPYEVTVNRAFPHVMEACAAPRKEHSGTWISAGFLEAYQKLHRAGHAHSVECWQDGILVGGIYGVSVGGLFAGESMFHRADNASKVVLLHLVERLNARGFGLFDIQMVTPATESMGAISIPRAEYLDAVKHWALRDCSFL